VEFYLKIQEIIMLSKTAVITVTYKYPKNLLKKFIKSIEIAGIKRRDIYIRDNTKDDIGYAAGINKIIKKQSKSYNYFLIINPDTLVNKQSIKILLKTIQSSQKIGIVGPKILDEGKNIWSTGGKIDKVRFTAGLRELGKLKSKVIKPSEVDFIPGTAMLIRREVFEDIGLFEEDYFLYYEEVDFCIKAKRAGFKLIVNPTAVITHYPSSTVGKNSPAMRYFMARNHLLLVERFAPFFIKFREAIRLPKSIYQARNDKFELLGIVDYFLRRFGNNKKMLSQIDL